MKFKIPKKISLSTKLFEKEDIEFYKEKFSNTFYPILVLIIWFVYTIETNRAKTVVYVLAGLMFIYYVLVRNTYTRYQKKVKNESRTEN